jgi:hypothetical protein
MLASTLFVAWIACCGGVERIGRLDHPPIREASGIVASRKHPGIFWVHNDSGNPPAIYAVKRDGRLVREFVVGVANLDWEDIATDDAGHLFLGDIGNNEGRLPIRVIYRIDEPDPAKPAKEPLPVTLSSYYRFPSRAERFDAESLVIEKGRALIVAKTFDKRPAEIYAIPLDPPASLLKPALPELVGTLPGFTEPVTGASLSDDGKWLAACSLEVTRVYERGAGGWKFLGSVRYLAEGIEAITWDGRDLLIAGEGRGIYRIKDGSWRDDPRSAVRP